MQFQENAWTEGQTEGQKGEQTLFYRTLTATAEATKNFPQCLTLTTFIKSIMDV